MNQIDLNITNQFTLMILYGDMFSVQIQGPQAQIFRPSDGIKAISGIPIWLNFPAKLGSWKSWT